jgi:hypothetical protein
MDPARRQCHSVGVLLCQAKRTALRRRSGSMASRQLRRPRTPSPCSARSVRSSDARRRRHGNAALLLSTSGARGRHRLLARPAVDGRTRRRSALGRPAPHTRSALRGLWLADARTGRSGLGAAGGLGHRWGRGGLRRRSGLGSLERSWCGRGSRRGHRRGRRLRRDRWRRCRRRGRKGGGRRSGCRGRVGGTPRREQAEWVDVRVVVADPDSEMDVGGVVLCIAGGTGVSDRISLADRLTLPDAENAEMRQRGLVAARGHDRDSQPVRRNLTGERDLPGRRRTNRG